MKYKKVLLILIIFGIIGIGYVLIQTNDKPIIVYSTEEQTWINNHVNRSLYYYVDGEVDGLFDELIITLELLLKMDFVEAADIETMNDQNGVIFSMNKEEKQGYLKSRTIYTNRYGIYTRQEENINDSEVKRLGVLKSDKKHIDVDSTYAMFEITAVNNVSDLYELMNSGYIDCFVVKDNFPLLIDRNERQYVKYDDIYSIDESLIIYLDKSQSIVQQILNKNINYIKVNNILLDLQMSELVEKQKQIFQSILTDEESQWISEHQTIIVGVDEKAPEVIKNDDKLYGVTIGMINQIGKLTGIETKYIYGEIEKLITEAYDYNIDLVWSEKETEEGTATLPFIESNYVVIGISNEIELNSKYDLQQYNVGMVFNSKFTTQLSNELSGANIEFYNDEESLVENLVNNTVELIILPKNNFDYYEVVKGYSEFDIRYEFEDKYYSSLVVLNDNEMLISIINKVISVQDLKLLESTSFNNIPKEESITFLDFIGLYIIILIVIPMFVFILIKMHMNDKETKQMNYLFTHDQLTHLPNKYGLQQHVADLVSKETTVGILLIDIDNLKDINDRLGHLYGDQVIIEYSQRLLAVLEKNIILGRAGGEKFVLVSPNIKEEAIKNLVSEVKLHTENFKNEKKELYNFTVSIAITLYPNHGETYNELYKYAEYTLDYTKAIYGSNSDLVFTYDIYDNFVKEQKMIKEIQTGILNEEFVLYIQPQVLLPNETVIGGEILVRWNHPVLGLVFPDTFIPIAEKNGLMRELDYYILHKSCDYIKKLQTRMDRLEISVNMSTTTFEDANLIKTIEETIAEVKLDTKWLTIEVTEDMGFHNMEKANAIFEALRDLGISVALDDFGKGYSSLAYLERLSFDTLKIDKVFIDNIHIKKESFEIFKTIASLAETMNINIVAEGVEYIEQVEILRERPNTVIQGYYYSKPMSIELFEEYIQNKQK